MNFIESCESVSELSYVIFPYLFKRRNESNQFFSGSGRTNFYKFQNTQSRIAY